MMRLQRTTCQKIIIYSDICLIRALLVAKLTLLRLFDFLDLLRGPTVTCPRHEVWVPVQSIQSICCRETGRRCNIVVFSTRENNVVDDDCA